MNRRQIINKILHDHIDVNKHEDYTNYKKLITAIEEWHESEVKKLPIHIVSKSVAKQYTEFCVRCDREGLPLLELDDYIKQYCC